MPDQPPPPWERQPGESAKAFAAFVVYRDQDTGERSLRDAARTLDKSLTVVGQWSKRWGWVERVVAWDVELDRQHRQSLVRRRRLARERHLRLAATALELASLQLEQITTRVRADGGEPMRDADVIRLLTEAARLERDVLGEVQAIDVTSGGAPLPPAATHVHLGDLTSEEARERLVQLQAEIARRLEAEQPEEPTTTTEETP